MTTARMSAAGTAEWTRLQEVPHGRAPWRHWAALSAAAAPPLTSAEVA
jgi:hypothetical protein